MIEPIVAFALCLLISLYLRFFERSGVRDLEFERWIVTDPVVLAFRPVPGRATEVAEAVRQSLAGALASGGLPVGAGADRAVGAAHRGAPSRRVIGLNLRRNRHPMRFLGGSAYIGA